jgi:hypothetical protein
VVDIEDSPRYGSGPCRASALKNFTISGTYLEKPLAISSLLVYLAVQLH